MRITGIDEVPVQTSAIALAARLPTLPPGVLLPVAICPPSTVVPGQVYNITDRMNGPGNFGWLSWTGDNAANILSNSVCNPDNPDNPDNPEITVPLYVPGNRGGRTARICATA